MSKQLFTNEELVKMYKETSNEKFFNGLVEQNMGLMLQWVDSYCGEFGSIPHAEQEDLLQECCGFVLPKAIKDYDPSLGFSFITLYKRYVRQHLNRLYNEATRQKRHTGSINLSLDELSAINKECGDTTESSFIVECEDIRAVELRSVIQSINFSEKERIVVTVLMAGKSKGDVAKVLNCTPATANYYFKRIKEKLKNAGLSLNYAV